MMNLKFTIHRGLNCCNTFLRYCIPILALLVLIGENSNAQCALFCSPVQVSLDENCEAIVTPGMVADSSTGCMGPLTVEIREYPGGPVIPTNPMITGEYIGQTLNVRVIDEASGNSCWTTALVEDKLPPTIVCSNDTLPCYELGGPVENILYAPSDPDDPAWRAAITSATGANVDYFNANLATPTLAQMINYDAVIVWANQSFDDPELYGDRLADYVDAGGIVVLGQFNTYFTGNDLDGRIMEPEYSPVTSPTGTAYFGNQQYAGDGFHPVFNGITDLSTDFSDNIIVQGSGAASGTFTPSGNITFAYRPDYQVMYANGMGDYSIHDPGDWAEYVNNMLHLAMPGPIAFDACSPATTILISETSTELCDSTYIREVTRSYTAVDASGNRSDTCTSTILLERIDLDSVETPDSLTVVMGTALNCEDNIPLDPSGNPAPSFTGVPTIDGIPLYPQPLLVCNVAASYEDINFPPLGCVEKIMRMWTIREWNCMGEQLRVALQIIEIADTSAPEITCPPDFTASTSPVSCSAMIFLPAIDVNDACENFDPLTGVTMTTPVGFIASNGGLIELPVGENEIVYRVQDLCGNVDSCVVTVTVEDNTAPIAVCDEFTRVSVGTDGTARVYAETFDDGSHDDCGPIDSFLVRRMTPACGYDNLFRDYIEVSCCDIGDPIMVVLRVFDASGNTNECMVELTVEDKLPALITCPPDVTVSCEFPFDVWDLDLFGTVRVLNDLNDLNDPLLDPRDSIIINDPFFPGGGPGFVGLDGYAFDNCGVTIVVDSFMDIDNCGEGIITRTFTAIGEGNTAQAVCTQTITVTNFEPFDESDIIWPLDYEVDGQCEAGSLDPDDLPAPFDRPVINEDACDLIGIRYEDAMFNIDNPNDPACFKILRTWEVIDWCTFNGGSFEIFSYTQVIKVMSSLAPVFDSCNDVSICSYDNECGPAFISIPVTATDDCTPADEINYTYAIDLDDDGTFDLFGNTNDASGVYPVGTHRIVYTAEDGCGNSETCEFNFTIENCKTPIAYCYNGLATDLGLMDIDGDGLPETPMVMLWAADFDAGSFHTCGYDITVSFSPTDPTDTGIVFDCTDLGINEVSIFAHDQNGRVSECVAIIDVQDNQDLCTDSLTAGDIAGLVIREDNESIQDVKVEIVGMVHDVTEQDGQYGFDGVMHGYTYTVRPEKNDDYRNGVTAWDELLIKKHILGLEPFTSPYKYIAADINRDEKITATDLVQLKKLVLNIYNEFPENSSWRFIDRGYEFTTSDPLSEDFTEEYKIEKFDGNMTDVDFIGVKIGDINMTAVPHDLHGGEVEVREALVLESEEEVLSAGSEQVIEVKASADAVVNAWQMTWKYNAGVAEIFEVGSGAMSVDADMVNLHRASEGMVSMSWAEITPVEVEAGDVLFTLHVRVFESTRVSGLLSVSDVLTASVSYTPEGSASEIAYRVSEVDAAPFALYQNTPNPFDNSTTIGFDLPEAGMATVTILDVTGRVVYSDESEYGQGFNQITVSSDQIKAAGVLYYRVESDGYSATKKMVVIR